MLTLGLVVLAVVAVVWAILATVAMRQAEQVAREAIAEMDGLRKRAEAGDWARFCLAARGGPAPEVQP